MPQEVPICSWASLLRIPEGSGTQHTRAVGRSRLILPRLLSSGLPHRPCAEDHVSYALAAPHISLPQSSSWYTQRGDFTGVTLWAVNPLLWYPVVLL
jgi:hypothetical protein